MTTCMNLEDIMLSGIATHRKTNAAQFHLREVPGVVKFTETESRIVAKAWWGEAEGELVFSGYSFSWRRGREFWRRMVVMVARQCECT